MTITDAQPGSATYRSRLRYRSIGSIGYIIPPRCNETVIEEAIAIRPAGVAWCFATLGLSNLESILYADSLAQVDAAVQDLLARQVDVIVYGGMPLTAAQGVSYYSNSLESQLREMVAGKVPVSTDTSIVLEAVRALGVTNCAVVTPFREQTLNQVCDMLAAGGMTIGASSGLGYTLPEFITRTQSGDAYDAALQAFSEAPDIDGFYLSCPQWPLVDNIARIEEATGKPVVTQVQSILWWARRQAGWPVEVSGYGRLLSDPSIR